MFFGGIMKHEDFAKIIKCNTWKELCESFEEHCLKEGIWIFRGQKDFRWDIKTTFERLTDATKPKDISGLEFGLLRKFEREFPLYSARMPRDGDYIEWFSLMQHHGAPTRLLDWTYSFYVATYFALDDIEWDKKSAIWAISSKWLEDKLFSKYPSYKRAFLRDRNFRNRENLKKIFQKLAVVKINPYYVHGRLSVQQGCFLFPGDTTKPFLENLLKFAGSKDELKKHLIKFVITENGGKRKAILEHLFRMNITRTSLFPGIDGYASSLKITSFILPETLKPGEEYWAFKR